MPQKIFYVLKVKGIAKIPDYIQVRDENFTLIGYFRAGRMELNKPDVSKEIFVQLEKMTENIPFGKITPITLEV
ncbi:MAG: fructose-6-phosphate aldolase [Bacteroidia bacterium]|nr:fructose-6-phosphate aldolase [Bacteroidia bacterium]MDW8159623.1 fructose-6-phosphate aldolase [Bacteroidia bacterium]